MLTKKDSFKNAAKLISAAFFILTTRNVFAAIAHKSVVQKQQEVQLQQLQQAKKKITSLLLLKQRPQALEIIQELQNQNTLGTEISKKVYDLKLIVLTSFLTAESQDYFELAASQYLNQSKLALKNAQKCLSGDPDQLFCLWAEAKAASNSKNSSRYLLFVEKMKILARDIAELEPLVMSLDKKQPEFLNYKFANNLVSEVYDYSILSLILEFDRSMAAKNFLLAKETIAKIEQQTPDYIDLIIMKAQLEKSNYTDESTDLLLNFVTIYKKKCEAVSPDVARKYFFDIDFCKRTLE